MSSALLCVYVFPHVSVSRMHFHPFCTEEPQQVGPGGCALLGGRVFYWCPHHRMDLHVWSGEPLHRDLAALGGHQYNSRLQQQGKGLWEWLHDSDGPAAAGHWVLSTHRHRAGRKQQGCGLCSESKRWGFNFLSSDFLWVFALFCV